MLTSAPSLVGWVNFRASKTQVNQPVKPSAALHFLYVSAGIIALGLTPISSLAAPHVIWQWESAYSGGTIGVFDSDFEFSLQFAATPSFVFLEPGIFSQVVWSNDTFGQTFVSSADNDSSFTATANELTNGVLGFVHQGIYEFGIWGQLEDTLFTYLALPEGNGIDLAGYRIEFFTLTVMSPSFNSPGSNPNGNGNWTDFEVPFVLAVYGYAVPEPTSLLLAYWAPMALWLVRRLSRK